MSSIAEIEQVLEEDPLLTNDITHLFCCKAGYAFCGLVYLEDIQYDFTGMNPPCAMCKYESEVFDKQLRNKYGDGYKGSPKKHGEHHRSCPLGGT